MKLQIDTVKMTIKIEESVNLGDLVEQVSNMFPPELWREFTLEVGVLINWQDPIIIDRWPTYPVYPTYPQQPWYVGDTTVTADNRTYSAVELRDGVFNCLIN